MTIEINYPNGWIKLDADFIIEQVSMPNYKKWLKLFAKYGTAEDHRAFRERLNIYIAVHPNEKKTLLEKYKRKQELLEAYLK